MSDNELKDVHGTYLVKLVKTQCDRRDLDLWECSLRQSKAEDVMLSLRRSYQMTNTYEAADEDSGKAMREIDSTPMMRRLLKNLDNSELHQPKAIQMQQAHILNFKKH